MAKPAPAVRSAWLCCRCRQKNAPESARQHMLQLGSDVLCVGIGERTVGVRSADFFGGQSRGSRALTPHSGDPWLDLERFRGSERLQFQLRANHNCDRKADGVGIGPLSDGRAAEGCSISSHFCSEGSEKGKSGGCTSSCSFYVAFLDTKSTCRCRRRPVRRQTHPGHLVADEEFCAN